MTFKDYYSIEAVLVGEVEGRESDRADQQSKNNHFDSHLLPVVSGFSTFPLLKVAVYRYVFNDIHNCGQCISNYYKIFTKNLVLYKYLSLNIIRFVFYSGIWRAARRVL